MRRLLSPTSDTPDNIAAAFDVSRETAADLALFKALVERWTKTVNLIGPATLPDIWTRHIVDSAQLLLVGPPDPTRWLDIGSGGGFPGLVCALFARDAGWGTAFALVESDKRKAAFLASASRELRIDAKILPQRVEEIPPQRADVVSARALGPLSTLLAISERHGTPTTRFLFPKGARHAEEIEAAERDWCFTLERHASITDPEARILDITALSSRKEVSQR